MLRMIALLGTLSLSLASIAHAAWLSPKGRGACVKNMNPWGHSSHCQCLAETARYQQELGQCLLGEDYPILVSGRIDSKAAAEQKVYLETELGRFQLVLSLEQYARVKKADGLYFEAEGQFILLPAAQANAQASIIVKSLNWLE